MFYYSQINPQLHKAEPNAFLKQKEMIRSMAHLHRHDHGYFLRFNILELYATTEYCITLHVHKCLFRQDNAMFFSPNDKKHLQLSQCCSTHSQASFSRVEVEQLNRILDE